VVLDADDLPASAMQTLAIEFGLSETAFPVRATPAEAARGVAYRLRIFTPVLELPFAGHPSIGTAWLMHSLGRVRPGRIVQACGAGDLALQVPDGDGPVDLSGGRPTVSGAVETGDLLAATGLRTDDLLDPARLAPRVSGTGLDYAHLVVRPDALARCVPDLAALREIDAAYSGSTGVYVWSWEAGSRTADARMFSGDLGGSAEDAATGSAALALGVYAVAAGLLPAVGTTGYTVVQGRHMGRPSLLTGSVDASDGQAVAVRVAGEVVPVASGRIRVPAG
jgi:trans-2,3-dihydro-3-hydroxyanthranilate isomerase